MSIAPPEVGMPVELQGTNGADLLLATAAVVTAHPNFADNPVNLYVLALNGDDGIVRDRIGTYGGEDYRFGDAIIDGGIGFDIVNYNSADGPITARLDQTWTTVNIGGQEVHVQSNSGYSLITSPPLPIAWENNFVRGADQVSNVEGIVGTVFDDEIRGDGKANRLWGHDGDDVIHGNGGNDQLYGGKGDDYLSGGKGNDTVHGDDGDDEIYGQDGNDVIHAGHGNDQVHGGRGADVIHGGDGSNDLHGDAGNDSFHLGGFSTNQVDGGSGVDTIVFTQQAVVNLFNGFAMRGAQGLDGTDSIVGVENVTTGKHADVVIGDDGRNVIHVGSGADTVLGGDGNDSIHGGNGNDSLVGGDGDDFINAGRGADRIRGGEGADTIWLAGIDLSGAERDVLVWGAGDVGLDTVSGFSVAHDRLNFSEGFLATGPQEDNLLVFFDGADAMLAANIAGLGWEFIATFEDVNAIALTNAIESGSIFDVQTTGLGEDGPGGFGLPNPVEIALGVNLQIMF